MGTVLGILCQRCRGRGNTQIIQTKKVKKTKESSAMHSRMKNFTAARDEQLDQDVEGQMLAGVLATLREKFGADSKEYNGIRELLISGVQVEELQGRAQALEEGFMKYGSDTPEYVAYRKRCLCVGESGGSGGGSGSGGRSGSGSGGSGGGEETLTKKKKKKHKHKHRDANDQLHHKKSKKKKKKHSH